MANAKKVANISHSVNDFFYWFNCKIFVWVFSTSKIDWNEMQMNSNDNTIHSIESYCFIVLLKDENGWANIQMVVTMTFGMEKTNHV